ncbi:nucleotidyltransferase domain-containing protein [Liberiplasma polymorphum]|uniref:nucleotidyltransferase domain-containing protein n=1 Tax=Liberiplasma polymorphum TaxID=3374570 RepID=UPI003774F0F1
MDSTYTQLFESVKYVLLSTYYTDPILDEKTFYKIAHENGLSGMIFSILPKESFSEEIYNLFKKDFYAYNASDMKQLALINTLKSLFNTHEINHIFLKGVHLKQVYPASYMRSMGDIDILVDEASFSKIKPLLKANNFTLTSTSDAHDCYLHDSGLEIEIHPKLTRTFKTKQTELFDQVWHYAKKEKDFTYQLDVTFELVYLLNHMAKHFYGSGVGLRTVLDIGLFTKKYCETLDLGLLDQFLEETEYETFFMNMLYLNKRYFNLNPFPFIMKNVEMDETLYTMLTGYIIKAGVHGTGESFNQFIGRTAHYKLQNKGKTALLRSILFPKYSDMKGLYPWLKKLPFLLPFAYIHRVIKLTLFRTKRSFTKYKQLRSSNAVSEQAVDLYKKLGL